VASGILVARTGFKTNQTHLICSSLRPFLKRIDLARGYTRDDQRISVPIRTQRYAPARFDA